MIKISFFTEILLIIAFLSAFLPSVYGQSGPGGVVPSAWYKADAQNTVFSDAGVTNATDNATVQQWNEYLGTGHDLIQNTAGSRPIFSNATTLVNFNPTLSFDLDYLEYQPGTGVNIIDRANGTLYTAGYFNTVGAAGIMGFDASMDYPGLHTSNNGLDNLLFYTGGPGYQGLSSSQFSDSSYFIAGSNWENGAGASAVYASSIVSLDGVRSSYNNTELQNAVINDASRDIRVGRDSNWGGVNGQVNEVIIFETALTFDEMDRVESYLSIKYGTTYASGASDYKNSSSAVVWNATNNAAYNENIFGIARDDVSELYQKQSKSTNQGQKMIMSAGNSLFDTNAANTNTLTDGQFLMVGDNGLEQNLKTPLVYTAGANGETNFRFEAIWKTQNTGSVGAVTIAWPKRIGNLYLVQSTDGTIDATDTFTPMADEATINGEVYNTATVTLTDGEFFTLAGFGYAPGGVVNGLSYWYRADKNTDNTGAGTDVTTWTDFFSGTVVSQLGTNDFPKYVEGAVDYFNFNPGVNFTANTQTLGNINVQTVSELEFDIFTLTKEGLTDSGGNPRVFSSLVDNDQTSGSINYWDGIGILADERLERVNNAYGSRYLGNPGGITWSTTIPSIMYHKFTDVSLSKGLNGDANGTEGTHGARGFMNGGHAFGDTRFSSNGSDNAGFVGDIGETIVYGTGSLDATQRRRVDSYLAIKYGITLSRVETDHYLGATVSATSIVWDGTENTAYNNNIFGVARSDIGGFEQKVSRSANTADNILTMATTADFTLPNTDASRTSFANDETYLLLGDNNNTTTTPLVDFTVEGNEAHRIQRIWLSQRTDTPGTIFFEADLSAYGSLFTSGNTVYMLVADDEGFTTNVSQAAGTFTGGKWVFNYDFDDDITSRYITFAEVFTPCTGADTDGDGVPDMCDFDDDNDGILDTDECNASNIVVRGDFTTLPPSPGFFTPTTFATVNPDWIFQSTNVGNGNDIFWGNITSPFVFGNGIRFQRDGETQSLTQAITGWNYNQTPAILISKFAANNSTSEGKSSTLILSYSGVEYVRIVTANDMGSGATLTYSNGASGSLTSINVGTVYNDWTIDLPYGISDSGNLTFDYLAGPAQSDDFSIGNVIVNACGDTDGDGIPDFLDLDSDNDGCPDALEGDGTYTESDLDPDGSINTTTYPVDENGVPNNGNSQGVGTSRDNAVANCDCPYAIGVDSDGDGIDNACDLDDDNDGILDTDECPTSYLVSPVNTSSITTSGVITSGNAQQLVDGEGAGGTGTGPFPNWYTNIGNLPIEFSMDMQSLSTIDHIKLYGPWGNDEWISDFTIELYDGGNVLLGTENLTAPDQYVSGLILSFSQEYTNVSHIEFTIISSQGYSSANPERASLNEIVFLDLQPCVDTDGDGIPNYLDLDSDNDGCLDTLEGDGAFTELDLVASGGTVMVGTGSTATNLNLCADGSCINVDGVPNIAAGGQGIGSSQDNTVNGCYCTQPGAIGTPTEFTKVGISDREGAVSTWPGTIPNGFMAIQSEDSGFVITRLTTVQISNLDAVEGMLVYDTDEQCIKLYNGTDWNCIERSCNE